MSPSASSHSPRDDRELGPLREAATHVASEAACPVDHSREARGLTALERRGYTEEFAVSGELVRVARTGRHFRPEELVIRDYYRFEGTSDPDDMAVVYALEARDGTRGTLTDAFGVYADPAVGAAVARMQVAPVTNARRRWKPLAGALLGALAVTVVVVAARRHAAPGAS